MKNFNLMKTALIVVAMAFSFVSCDKDDEITTPEPTTPTTNVDITNENTWETSTLGSENLNKIYFTSKQKGFIAGNNGKLYKTTDAGETWATVNTGITHDLRSISFYNQKGNINGLTTNDGGNTWTSQPETVDYYTYLTGANSSVRGTITSFEGLLGYSSDNVSWNTVLDIETGYYHNGTFKNNTGFLVTWYSGFIVKTTNNGASWTTVLSSLSTEYDDFHDVSFMNDNEIIVSGTKSILKSANNGTSFSNVYQKNGAIFRGIEAYNENQWVAVSSQGDIISTKNAGANWKEEQIPNTLFTDVAISEKYIIAIAENGKIVKKKITE